MGAARTVQAHPRLSTSENERARARPVTQTGESRRAVRPVVEAAVARGGERFVANDCTLSEGSRLWLVTGPNMGGKSTFLRQNALIAVLAQAGSYVPATSATLGLVDRLFSRVGASDNLARGRSTFMVEMVETAAILAQATPRSFVILDEVGHEVSYRRVETDGAARAAGLLADLV